MWEEQEDNVPLRLPPRPAKVGSAPRQEQVRGGRRARLVAEAGGGGVGDRVALSVKATRSGQEGGGRQSGDGVGGGEVGGERGATRGATACVARAVGCASVVLVRVLRWGCMRRQTWRRRLHKQTAAGRQSRAGAERRGERAASMLSMMSPTNSGGFGVWFSHTHESPFLFSPLPNQSQLFIASCMHENIEIGPRTGTHGNYQTTA